MVIKDRFILTAASCVTLFTADQLTVYAGSNNLISSQQKAHVEKIIIHSGFQGSLHNVAVLQLKSKLTLGTSVNKISLSTSVKIIENTKVLISGFASSEVSSVAQVCLKSVSALVKLSTSCNLNLAAGKKLSVQQFCLATLDAASSLSLGSPVVQNNVLVGIATHEQFDASTSVFARSITNVAFYVDFIASATV